LKDEIIETIREETGHKISNLNINKMGYKIVINNSWIDGELKYWALIVGDGNALPLRWRDNIEDVLSCVEIIKPLLCDSDIKIVIIS